MTPTTLGAEIGETGIEYEQALDVMESAAAERHPDLAPYADLYQTALGLAAAADERSESVTLDSEDLGEMSEEAHDLAREAARQAAENHPAEVLAIFHSSEELA